MADQKDEFDDFVDRLQQEIIEKEFEDFNPYIVNLFHNPPNWGKPPDEKITVSNSFRGSCGDLMQFFLKVENNKIEKANFITDGCGASVAAGSQITLLIEGKTLEFAENLTPEDIDNALHGLPKDHKHCAELAVRTLKRLIKEFREKYGQEKLL
ncbi:MAG: iron-sulfur cluster assembly scaffold protein [Promethearchaeota archaeon]